MISALLFVWGLVLLARQPSEVAGKRGGRLPAGFLAILATVFLSIRFPIFFTVRPETIAMPFLVFAVLLWVKAGVGEGQRTVGMATGQFLAGILYGVVLFSSPRFLLAGGLFVLLPSARPVSPRGRAYFAGLSRRGRYGIPDRLYGA